MNCVDCNIASWFTDACSIASFSDTNIQLQINKSNNLSYQSSGFLSLHYPIRRSGLLATRTTSALSFYTNATCRRSENLRFRLGCRKAHKWGKEIGRGRTGDKISSRTRRFREAWRRLAEGHIVWNETHMVIQAHPANLLRPKSRRLQLVATSRKLIFLI